MHRWYYKSFTAYIFVKSDVDNLYTKCQQEIILKILRISNKSALYWFNYAVINHCAKKTSRFWSGGLSKKMFGKGWRCFSVLLTESAAYGKDVVC